MSRVAEPGTALRIRALLGDGMPVTDTKRNKLLRNARHIRALRSWVKEGCYAWWRLTDDLRLVQKEMAATRRVREIEQAMVRVA
jgi:hypothetical protein